jgi:hypothetical protein
MPEHQAANVELKIEELVLHGFTPRDRDRIGEALERELARLFSERGVPTSVVNGGEIPRLNAGSFNVTAGAKPEMIGAQLALQVYQGLVPSGE